MRRWESMHPFRRSWRGRRTVIKPFFRARCWSSFPPPSLLIPPPPVPLNHSAMKLSVLALVASVAVVYAAPVRSLDTVRLCVVRLSQFPLSH